MVYTEQQIDVSSTFLGYMKEGVRLKRWQAPLQVFKWVSSLLIKRQLKNIVDVHLVPSSYMEKLVQAHYPGLDHRKIVTLSHFV